MSSWIDEYYSALEVRDAREKAQSQYINAYTKLADRTAVLEANPVQPPTSPSPSPSVKNVARPSASRRGKSTSEKEEDATPADALARLRIDLATTQKSRADLQARLKPLNEELEKMKVKSERDLKRIEDLTREKVTLERKLRDREEELKGKARLVEEVQDEMVSLHLQLNMAEQRSEKLEKENKELVDRWMVRMGEEADAMNDASKWT
ncbi:MAG: hypothetical protein M1820_003206 [Bogoriella megaspora]|nr:MAG: hypothetical protein M1820_003206 [Bogoriella megaspora]